MAKPKQRPEPQIHLPKRFFHTIFTAVQFGQDAALWPDIFPDTTVIPQSQGLETGCRYHGNGYGYRLEPRGKGMTTPDGGNGVYGVNGPHHPVKIWIDNSMPDLVAVTVYYNGTRAQFAYRASQGCVRTLTPGFWQTFCQKVPYTGDAQRRDSQYTQPVKVILD